MGGSDEGRDYSTQNKTLLSSLVAFRAALFVSFNVENEQSNPVSLTNSDHKHRNGDFNIENAIFIFDLISYEHFYENSVYCSCIVLSLLNEIAFST